MAISAFFDMKKSIFLQSKAKNQKKKKNETVNASGLFWSLWKPEKKMKFKQELKKSLGFEMCDPTAHFKI